MWLRNLVAAWISFAESFESKGAQLLVLLGCMGFFTIVMCVVVIKFGPGAPVGINLTNVLSTFVGALVGFITGQKIANANGNGTGNKG